jgi:hypothetical protein
VTDRQEKRGLAFEDRTPSVGASAAAAIVLAGLLRTVRARVHGGEVEDRVAEFSKVFEHWPSGPINEPPAASITEKSPPTDDLILADFNEESFLEDIGAALLQNEVGGSFQVDVWCRDTNERRAFMAAIPVAFRGRRDVDRSGSTVYLPMPLEALPIAWRTDGASERLGLFIRLTLSAPMQEIDSEDSARRREWRATAEVEWDAEVVSAEEIHRIRAIIVTGDGVSA